MKLTRANLEGAEVVGSIDGDEFTLIGEGGQDFLLQIATGSRPVEASTPPIPLDQVKLLAPINKPPSIRDFFAFEAHMVASRASAHQEPDPGWYEQPFFYFTNPAAVVGPGELIIPPRGTRALDYELEVGAVIGRECSNLDPDDPRTMDVIAGFTILNDWSARDIQGVEMKQNIGPQKAKDFATSIGPWLVTPDEMPFRNPSRPAGRMMASVNGEQWSDGELADIHFPWTRLLAHASQDTRLVPGDILGSGTCGTGCILELRGSGLRSTRHWLRSGDRVELTVAGLGTLTNTIGKNPADTRTK